MYPSEGECDPWHQQATGWPFLKRPLWRPRVPKDAISLCKALCGQKAHLALQLETLEDLQGLELTLLAVRG